MNVADTTVFTPIGQIPVSAAPEHNSETYATHTHLLSSRTNYFKEL